MVLSGGANNITFIRFTIFQTSTLHVEMSDGVLLKHPVNLKQFMIYSAALKVFHVGGVGFTLLMLCLFPAVKV